MRLTKKEHKAIQFACLTLLKNVKYEVFLFGSRTDDTKKGGDIDLLILTSENDKTKIIDLKVKLKLKIFEMISEQKIDITIATDHELMTNEFLKSIKNDLIKLLKQKSEKPI